MQRQRRRHQLRRRRQRPEHRVRDRDRQREGTIVTKAESDPLAPTAYLGVTTQSGERASRCSSAQDEFRRLRGRHDDATAPPPAAGIKQGDVIVPSDGKPRSRAPTTSAPSWRPQARPDRSGGARRHGRHHSAPIDRDARERGPSRDPAVGRSRAGRRRPGRQRPTAPLRHATRRSGALALGVKVRLRNPDREVDVPGGRTVRAVLTDLGVNPDTVLVIRAGELVTRTERVARTTCWRSAR